MEEGGAEMEQWNDETIKLDEFHGNLYEIRTNFM